MTKEYEITNAQGHRFYIETAADFDEKGNVVAGRGFFAGLIHGNDMMSGLWFPTEDMAIKACNAYRV